MVRVQNENGTPNRASIIRLSKHLTLRSRKRRSSDELGGTVKSFPSGFDLHTPRILPSLTPSDSYYPEETQENRSGRRDRERRADA